MNPPHRTARQNLRSPDLTLKPTLEKKQVSVRRGESDLSAYGRVQVKASGKA